MRNAESKLVIQVVDNKANLLGAVSDHEGYITWGASAEYMYFELTDIALLKDMVANIKNKYPDLEADILESDLNGLRVYNP